jgi:two-component system OmpR family response regulator
MTQVHNEGPVTAGGMAAAGFAAPAETAPAGWLALADPDGPVDLARFFPDVEIRVESVSTAFSDALSAGEPGLVVLIEPPAGPGDLQRVAAWRATHVHSRAVLLSAHRAVAARLHALEIGFDDALDLSSDPMEVVGRLSIAGRRTAGPTTGPNYGSEGRILVGAGVELDRRAHAIRRGGKLLPLRPKEMALLEFLVVNPGRAFTRAELLDRLWHDLATHPRVVDVYVFWLRSKIERDPANPVHLLTVRGSGYLFDPPSYPVSPEGWPPSLPER